MTFRIILSVVGLWFMVSPTESLVASSSSTTTTTSSSSNMLLTEYDIQQQLEQRYLQLGWTAQELRIVEESTRALQVKLAKHKAQSTASQPSDWPIQIFATAVNPVTNGNPWELPPSVLQDDSTKTTTSTTKTITKLVHFQRHGEGYHNLFGKLLRDSGITPQLDSRDPGVNPWLRPEIVDSPLTDTGKRQCRQRQPETRQLNPQAVIVSPLCRAIDTARLSFAHYYPSNNNNNNKNIPWVVDEGCREDLGLLVCNQRRGWSEIRADYPELDYSGVDHTPEEDTLWLALQDRRENPDEIARRIYDFLTTTLLQRPEDEVAVVTHSGWLFYMLNNVVDCLGDSTLERVFLTSEIRSLRLSFVVPQNDLVDKKE